MPLTCPKCLLRDYRGVQNDWRECVDTKRGVLSAQCGRERRSNHQGRSRSNEHLDISFARDNSPKEPQLCYVTSASSYAYTTDLIYEINTMCCRRAHGVETA